MNKKFEIQSSHTFKKKKKDWYFGLTIKSTIIKSERYRLKLYKLQKKKKIVHDDYDNLQTIYKYTIIINSLSLLCLYHIILESLWGCLVYIFKQQFSVFKQHFTHFNTLFHPHVFSQMFLNNNFQFLNTHTRPRYQDTKFTFV